MNNSQIKESDLPETVSQDRREPAREVESAGDDQKSKPAAAPGAMSRRIIFLDLMRAIAVIMMVQGHTIDIFLSDAWRDPTTTGYWLWLFFRGLTAPIFLFTAGTVFIYLFTVSASPYRHNPRISKGIRRFLLLVAIGYLLRFPSVNPFNFSKVSEESWKIFFAVDTLQLIGFGVLFLVILGYLSERFRLNAYALFAGGGIFFFFIFPFTEQIDWASFLPSPVAGYFYAGTGSNFPLIPWVGYLLFGGVLGASLARGHFGKNPKRFSLILALSSLSIIVFSQALNYGADYLPGLYGPAYDWLSLVILRLGMVMMFNALLAVVTASIHSVHPVIIMVGRRTLLIYVVHLVILYGSAWNNGLARYYGKSLDVVQTIGAALLMIGAMVVMSVVYPRISGPVKAAVRKRIGG
ncbi:MAG: DUF1624 domain-containing protein [Acidobacteriota bacterium]|nr:MAG: DUF1624 domain-containing protein [Acidobacteriota bacterium]